MSALLPLSENQSAHDGDEDEEGCQLERIDEGGEEHGREIRCVSERVRAGCVWNRAAAVNHGRCEKSGQRKSEWQATKLCELRKIRVLFFAGVQKHDHKNEQHHDRSAINDDLHGGDEFRAQQKIQAGECNHHHNQRKRAVNGMFLQNQAQGADDRKCSEDEEYDERCAHRLLRKSTNPAVTMTLAIETGSRSFQPIFMSWS